MTAPIFKVTVNMRCIRRTATVMVLTTMMAASAIISIGPAQAAGVERGRIRVKEVSDAFGGKAALKVLRTDTNTPLRAGTAWVWSQDPTEQPAEYYRMIRECGMNSVRIICFDVWIHENGYDQEGKLDWNNKVYRDTSLARIRRAVDHCAANGLYAIVNCHGRIQRFDSAYASAFWKAVAPVFKGRKHVIYELQNEPLGGAGRLGVPDANDLEVLKKLRSLHDEVRKLAPDTHLMLLTPAGISGHGSVDAMNVLTRTYAALPGLPIDWSKASVAYHLYHADPTLFPTAENLRRFHAEFPGWPSENNFPVRITGAQLGAKDGDSERSVSFGKHEFTVETCERLGLGWSQWHIEGMDRLEKNWPILWDDAVKKGYAWKPDVLRKKK